MQWDTDEAVSRKSSSFYDARQSRKDSSDGDQFVTAPESASEISRRDSRRSKGKMSIPSTPAAVSADNADDVKRLALVVFACRHVYHRVCIDEEFREGRPMRGMYRCPVCTEAAEEQK